MKRNILYVVLVILGISNALIGQNCDNFFESNCVMPTNWDYEINSQSNNIPMFKGQSIKYSVVLYEGYDYSISFCADEELGNVQYRLLSTEVYIDKTFNSYTDGNIQHVEFRNNTTRIILIEVKVLRSSQTIDPNDRHCLGIILGQKKVEDF